MTLLANPETVAAADVFGGNETARQVWARTEVLAGMGLQTHPDTARFDAIVPRTPLRVVPNDLLPKDLQDTGYQLYLKDDSVMINYKLRGTTSYLLAHGTDTEHVVVASTGNHAGATAEAATALGIQRMTAVCPEGTSLVKLHNVAQRGGRIVLEADLSASMVTAELMGEAPGALFVHPYNFPDVVAGQGTAALQTAEQLLAAGVNLDAVTALFYAVGGGGLLAGNAVAARMVLPGAIVRGARAIDADPRVDGAAVAEQGEVPMRIIRDRRLVHGVGQFSVAQVGEAMAVAGAYGDMKVPEPAGALGTAGALQFMRDNRTGSGVLVAHVSGANKTPEKVHEFMTEALDAGLVSELLAGQMVMKAYAERDVHGLDELIAKQTAGDTATRRGLQVLSSPAAEYRR